MMTVELTRARVLVADDDDGVRDSLCAILERQGCEIVGRAIDGAEAVTVAFSTDPEVVLMDLRMPIIDGIEASRRIRHRFPTTQVIVLSAYDDRACVTLPAGRRVLLPRPGLPPGHDPRHGPSRGRAEAPARRARHDLHLNAAGAPAVTATRR